MLTESTRSALLSPLLIFKKIAARKDSPSHVWSVIAPILCAFFGIQRGTAISGAPQRLMALGSIYAWALVGSSVGFYLFLYFISVGYALGILLPITVTLSAYIRYRSPLSIATILHASLVILWGVRLTAFLLWREYRNWPALHTKILQVNQERSFLWYQKVACWAVYSFLYVCLLTPCWFRLEEDLVPAIAGTAGAGLLSLGTRLGIALQILGLSVETAADLQKSTFKARHRLDWCRTGLWKYSPHPNYAGEWLFWFGTWIAGGAARSWPEAIMSLVGLAFVTVVLNGASKALEKKQRSKYGVGYAEFRDRTTIWGPKFWTRGRSNDVPTVNATSITVESDDADLDEAAVKSKS